jgi:predicted SAM-dependent methyltransferase
MALHLIEHFYLWEADDVLQEWRRLLKPGGRLILELPNLEAACRNYLRLKKKKGQSNLAQMAMWPLYGDPSHEDVYMCHHWAYDPDTITELLEANGFEKVQILPPQTHGRRVNRDMRVEALRS